MTSTKRSENPACRAVLDARCTLDRGARVHVLCEENTRRGLALLAPSGFEGDRSEAIVRPRRICACERSCSRSASWVVPASLAALAAACPQRPPSSSPERGPSTAGRKQTNKHTSDCTQAKQCRAYVQQPEPLPRIAARGAVPHQRRERVAVRPDRDALALLPQRSDALSELQQRARVQPQDGELSRATTTAQSVQCDRRTRRSGTLSCSGDMDAGVPLKPVCATV
jgi:hypothetical protein